MDLQTAVFMQEVRARAIIEDKRIKKLKQINDFAMGICAARRSAKLTQKQLADKLGVSVRTIVEYEKCYDNIALMKDLPQHLPPFDIVLNIAEVCNVPLRRLIPSGFT